MNRLKRLLLTVGLSTTLLLSMGTSVGFASGVINVADQQQQISNGVTHRNIVRFNANGWLNINALYIDLTADSLELDLLKSSKGVATKETLSTMVNARENVVGAMNGDFFYMLTPDSPLGAMIKGGEMISSPIDRSDQNYATFFVDTNKQAFASYWDRDLYITTDGGKRIDLSSINKYTDRYQYTMLIDKNWGTHTPGYNEKLLDMVEVIVINDEVAEIRRRQPATGIPSNGYVLVASQTETGWGRAGHLFDNLKVGDRLTLHQEIQPNLNQIELALGGGTLLVKDGQAAHLTQSVAGAHPRSAIGISRDRKQVILVTIDGRSNFYHGVDGRELGNILLGLGAHDAIIMDGGGSTTMIARELGEAKPQIINNPSEGVERRIVNGIAVLSKAQPTTLRAIQAKVNDPRAFVETPREILVNAYDENYNPIQIDHQQVKFNIKSGQGRFEGNSFIPEVVGKAIIEVEYLGRTAEVVIDVMNNLTTLIATPNILQVNFGQRVPLQVYGLDEKGYRTVINPEQIQWQDEKGLGQVENGVYVAGNQGGGTILTGTFRDKKVEIGIAIGYEQVSLTNFDKLNASYIGYPQSVLGSIELSPEAKKGSTSLKLTYDFTQTDESRAAYVAFDQGGLKIANKPSKLGMWVYASEQATPQIRGRIKDASGKDHTIDFAQRIDWTGWKYTEAVLPSDATYPIALERIYVVETDATQKRTGSLLFDGIEALYSVKAPGVESFGNNDFQDLMNRPYTNPGTQFFVHSGINQGGHTLLDQIVETRVNHLINTSYDTAIFTGSINSRISGQITKPNVIAKPGYGISENGSSLFIQLDNRGNGLRATDFSQWPWLQSQLQNTNKQNIFIVLPRPLLGNHGFTDDKEFDLLIELLNKQVEKDKNVFVLYGGDEMGVRLVDGIRYIALGNYQSTSDKDSQELFKYLEFNINGDEVTYQIKPLF
ncbi:Exopolysaccharide biosynthesis protein [Alkaliphilus metalliredigens QYMF]|uniref:Exopolysaccharide biosynthesis protein n=1 Tax=Alkaliphilus metalliredigens (strain QYMF) TaxID=293826 RepID=A6TVJ8_ALKMQ|nr:phosphodiester glycosidase family protein [Alkaliphilus metalliredigens]ABR50216.1 Exopolysaccharide biosynthesis protein [Alkaliphilus metalliredigens QYMF]